jgi:hypothetical protein
MLHVHHFGQPLKHGVLGNGDVNVRGGATTEQNIQ